MLRKHGAYYYYLLLLTTTYCYYLLLLRLRLLRLLTPNTTYCHCLPRSTMEEAGVAPGVVSLNAAILACARQAEGGGDKAAQAASLTWVRVRVS